MRAAIAVAAVVVMLAGCGETKIVIVHDSVPPPARSIDLQKVQAWVGTGWSSDLTVTSVRCIATGQWSASCAVVLFRAVSADGPYGETVKRKVVVTCPPGQSAKYVCAEAVV